MKRSQHILSFLVIALLGACAETRPLAWDQSGNQLNPVQSPSTRLSGTARQIMAIGGESTGMALETQAGDLVEIDFLNPSETRLFREGRLLEVTGQFETVRGVEIPVREVFFVKSARSL